MGGGYVTVFIRGHCPCGQRFYFRKESDLGSAFVYFPLLERICRGSNCIGCCRNPRTECRRVLAIHHVLGTSANRAVFSPSLPPSLQQLRSSCTPLGRAERNESSSLRELHRPSPALARYFAERRINGRRHAADRIQRHYESAARSAVAIPAVFVYESEEYFHLRDQANDALATTFRTADPSSRSFIRVVLEPV